MLPISELNIGFSDAENYKRRENKDLFNKIFLRTDSLDTLCERNIFFLIGEKGTGKTAYAVYLSNNNYKNNLALIKYIRETEYQKFLTLKKKQHLALSDYTNIWKVIIYLLLAEQISQKEKSLPVIGKYLKFHNLKKAIDEYYANAFSPEIMCAIDFVENSKLAAELISQHAVIGGEQTSGVSFTEKRFQTNLLYIQNNFEEAIGSLKLANNYNERGIGFVAISSNDVENYPQDSPELMKECATDLGYLFPYLYDETQEIAKAYDATCTPDFFLFDSELKLVYRGQLDDSRPSLTKPVTGKDIRNAFDTILAGKEVAQNQIPSMGCNIKWK